VKNTGQRESIPITKIDETLTKQYNHSSMNLPMTERQVSTRPDQEDVVGRGQLFDVLTQVSERYIKKGWEERADHTTELLGHYDQDFSTALLKATCAYNGLNEAELPNVLDNFAATELASVITRGMNRHSTFNLVRARWAMAVVIRPGIERAIQRDRPYFRKELDMMETELMVSTLKQKLIDPTTETFKTEIDFFGDQSNVALAALDSDIRRYRSYGARGVRPIEPEILITSVADGMKAVGWC
jgi:hypothetical protein